MLYYIAPQLWAWRPERAPRVRAAVDRLAVVFPFEAKFFASLGIPAEYVGHPLLDRTWPTRTEARAALGIPVAERVLGVFPGSRRQEVDRLWPAFSQAARTLIEQGRCQRALVAATGSGEYPGRRPADPDATPTRFWSWPPPTPSSPNRAPPRSRRPSADTPMVVAYRVHPLTEFFARRLIRVPWVSLVNLIAEAPVVDELLQGEVTAARLIDTAGPLLDLDHPATRTQRAGLARVRELLGRPGAARRVAAMAAELVG